MQWLLNFCVFILLIFLGAMGLLATHGLSPCCVGSKSPDSRSCGCSLVAVSELPILTASRAGELGLWVPQASVPSGAWA